MREGRSRSRSRRDRRSRWRVRRDTDSEGFRARLTTFMVERRMPGLPRPAAQRAQRGGAVGRGQAREDSRGKSRLAATRHFRRMALDDFVARRLPGGAAGNDAVREVVDGIEQRLHFLARDRTRLPDARSRIRDAVRRRGATRAARDAARHGPGRRHLRARRAEHRPASARQPEAARHAARAARSRQHGARGRARRGHDADRRRTDRTRARRRHAKAGRFLFQGTPAECAKLSAVGIRAPVPYLARQAAAW